MKRILGFLVLIFLFTDCKKEASPATAIEGIVGKWLMVETMSRGDKSWSSVNSTTEYINVRSNGLILGSNGFLPCCPPETLTINGILFKIPQLTDVLIAPGCASIKCTVCSNLFIEQSGNEMTITRCLGNREKYVRK